MRQYRTKQLENSKLISRRRQLIEKTVSDEDWADGYGYDNDELEDARNFFEEAIQNNLRNEYIHVNESPTHIESSDIVFSTSNVEAVVKNLSVLPRNLQPACESVWNMTLRMLGREQQEPSLKVNLTSSAVMKITVGDEYIVKYFRHKNTRR